MQRARYEDDDVAWAEEQIAQLRALEAIMPGINLDIEHIVEELDGMARSRRREARSYLIVILVHMLKLTHARDEAPKRSWELSVRAARDDLQLLLTPTVTNFLSNQYERVEQRAREQATIELLEHGDVVGAKAVESGVRPISFAEALTGQPVEPPPRPRRRVKVD